MPPKRPIVSAENIPSITHKTLEGEFLVLGMPVFSFGLKFSKEKPQLLLGYHEPPPMAVSPIFPARFPSFQFPTQSITWKQNDNDNPKQVKFKLSFFKYQFCLFLWVSFQLTRIFMRWRFLQLPAIGGPSAHSDQEPSLSAMIYHIYLLYPVQFYSVVISLILLLATTIWMCGRQVIFVTCFY